LGRDPLDVNAVVRPVEQRLAHDQILSRDDRDVLAFQYTR